MMRKIPRTLLIILLCVPLAVLMYRGCERSQYYVDGAGTMCISPDGNFLLFHATVDGGRSLYTFDLQQRRVKRIVETADAEGSPAFSRDGTSIVYESGVPEDRARHICVRNLVSGKVTQLTSGDDNDTSPAFSANGRTIVFARDTHYNCCGLASTWYVGGTPYAIDINGGNLRRLLPDSVHTFNLTVSPDGQTLLWTNDQAIFTAPMNGTGQPIRIFTGDVYDVGFSPDSNRIVFTQGRYASEIQLCVIPVHGGIAQILTQAGKGCSNPVFSSDGKTIYYRCNPDLGTGGSLMQIGSNGTNPQTLADSTLFTRPMSWRP